MIKNISRTKLVLALISLLITFFVWQQGLRDSLSRPSVSFDISQKENEISELALQSAPKGLKNFIIPDDPIEEIKTSIAKVPFDELTERNKFISIIFLELNENKIKDNFENFFKNENYNKLLVNFDKKFKDNSYKPDLVLFDSFKNDKFLYHLLSKKFGFDDSSLITKSFSRSMLIKILAIRIIPLLTVFIGIVLFLKTFWRTITLKKIGWKKLESLDLDLIDMILLIAGGFVVLGEVVSPLFSISLVGLFSEKISFELSQSLKIFFGYLFMAIPPLLIVYSEIKSLKGEFIFKKDYFQLNSLPIKDAIKFGLKGWLMIIPFVFLVSLIMNILVENQNGSNPLLEIVLNTDNYFSLILLFLTITVLAPLFEEIIFRGVLLPVLARDFGNSIGILISGFIFALAHLSIGELPPLLVLGIGLGVTRIVSGSLFSSVIMHSLWNGLTFLNLFLLRT